MIEVGRVAKFRNVGKVVQQQLSGAVIWVSAAVPHFSMNSVVAYVGKLGGKPYSMIRHAIARMVRKCNSINGHRSSFHNLPKDTCREGSRHYWCPLDFLSRCDSMNPSAVSICSFLRRGPRITS